MGVPSKKDIGQCRLSIKAFGKHHDVAKHFFTIHVTQDNGDQSKHNRKVRIIMFLHFTLKYYSYEQTFLLLFIKQMFYV